MFQQYIISAAIGAAVGSVITLFGVYFVLPKSTSIPTDDLDVAAQFLDTSDSEEETSDSEFSDPSSD